MQYFKKQVQHIFIVILWLGFLSACKESKVDPATNPGAGNPSTPTPTTFDINTIKDNYAEVASASNYLRWGPYNVHDPSIIKEGDTYYSYSTDAAYGTDIRSGIQIRTSKDLVEWTFYGWAFDGLPVKGSDFIKQSGGTPFNSLWAPYVIKAGNEFRLYYSLSSAKARLSVIGMASSSSPLGPWKEQGLAVVSRDDNTRQTNAIDPTVLIDPSGKHWLYYGSAWDGIYMLQLDPATGLALKSGDKGRRIANRGFTNGVYNGNIEGPEIIYNKAQKKYYLFIAYDWLETKYNVRVGRADSPEGPFYDFEGKDLNTDTDHAPMLIAPYQFQGHSGWQGTSHCAVFENNGQFYIAHQGRPGNDKYFMILHVRKLYWTKDGWPIASPERYDGVELTAVSQADLSGNWEQITLNYRVVPGYDKEQTSPDFQVSVPMKIDANGSFDNNPANKWSYAAPRLELTWADGKSASVYVERGRDWENKTSGLIFTGLTKTGIAVWGKKK